MVEVFKTNVAGSDQSDILALRLLAHFPMSKITFDLEDCDRILRIDGAGISTIKVKEVMNLHGYECTALE